MPPAGLDVDVLLALKAHFTRMLKQVIKSKQQTSLEEKHAHQSSPPSSGNEHTSSDPDEWFDKYDVL